MSRIQWTGFLAFVVAAALLVSSWRLAAQDGAAPKPDRWEYKHVLFLTGVSYDRETTKLDEFDKLGAEGWELVAVSVEKVAYFKRRK